MQNIEKLPLQEEVNNFFVSFVRSEFYLVY